MVTLSGGAPVVIDVAIACRHVHLSITSSCLSVPIRAVASRLRLMGFAALRADAPAPVHTKRRQTMASHPAAEHHTKAAEHHKEAAKHHEQAAEHYGKGDHAKAAEHAHHATGQHFQATHHVEEAAKSHATHPETKK